MFHLHLGWKSWKNQQDWTPLSNRHKISRSHGRYYYRHPKPCILLLHLSLSLSMQASTMYFVCCWSFHSFLLTPTDTGRWPLFLPPWAWFSWRFSSPGHSGWIYWVFFIIRPETLQCQEPWDVTIYWFVPYKYSWIELKSYEFRQTWSERWLTT